MKSDRIHNHLHLSSAVTMQWQNWLQIVFALNKWLANQHHILSQFITPSAAYSAHHLFFGFNKPKAPKVTGWQFSQQYLAKLCLNKFYNYNAVFSVWRCNYHFWKCGIFTHVVYHLYIMCRTACYNKTQTIKILNCISQPFVAHHSVCILWNPAACF